VLLATPKGTRASRRSSGSSSAGRDGGDPRVRRHARARGRSVVSGDGDRAAIVTLHRWSFLPEIERGDNVVLLVAENLAELSPKLVSNPKVAVVEVPMPDRETRRRAAAKLAARCSPTDADRYADLTAGPEGNPDRRDPDAAAGGEEDAPSASRSSPGILGSTPTRRSARTSSPR
jgi:hypothetical protein